MVAFTAEGKLLKMAPCFETDVILFVFSIVDDAWYFHASGVCAGAFGGDASGRLIDLINVHPLVLARATICPKVIFVCRHVPLQEAGRLCTILLNK
jgi:hypothetical protein